MKVIFLDFDGVLNSEKFVRKNGGFGVVIDPIRMELLRQITDSTGAKVVLSTSWREHWQSDENKCNEMGKDIHRIFREYGICIIGKTTGERLPREEQIKLWLSEHKDTENFVVLDDLILEDELLTGHFVKTYNGRNGLDDDNVRLAIEILGGAT